MEYGVCKFCGQAYMVEAEEEDSKETRDEMATAKCDCEGAKKYAWKKETLAVFRQDLEVVFSEEKKDFRELFHKAGQMIMEGRLASMSVKTDEDKTMGLKIKKSGLCITITQKSTMENISYG